MKMNGIITLLTDFGTEDEYVGVMKGVILSVNPAATIVDISHGIDPQNLTQAAFMIQAILPYFPEGTVHLSVIDPGVGTDRAILALSIGGKILLAPDNGILTLLLKEKSIASVIRVKNSDYFLKPVSRTFHGRDIFAPVAAHLSKGLDINALGPPVSPDTLVKLPLSEPHISDTGELLGTIIAADRFGNLMSDIDMKTLDSFCKREYKKLGIRIGASEIIGLSETYANVKPQQPLAIIGSRGYLEIAVNCGNAQRYFKVGKGDSVRIGK